MAYYHGFSIYSMVFYREDYRMTTDTEKEKATLINMNKVQAYLTEMADNARENGYPLSVEAIQSVQDHLLDFVDEERAARLYSQGRVDGDTDVVIKCDKDPQSCWSVRCQLGKECAGKNRFEEQPSRTPEPTITISQLKALAEGMKMKDDAGVFFATSPGIKGHNAALSQLVEAAEKEVV